MSESAWLVERVLCPDAPPFLHWVGPGGVALHARFATDWPPAEEDVDYMHERVKRDPVVLEDGQVAECLADEGFPDAEVRPLTGEEGNLLAAWRPFALVDRLLDQSPHVTIHGARCDAALPLAALAAIERAALALPHLVVLDGPPPFQLLVVLRRDDKRWRIDAGELPRAGQSLQIWLAGHHVRFTVPCHARHAGGVTLSGIRQRSDAEHLIIALQTLDASRALQATGDAPPQGQAHLDCSLTGPVPLRVLPDAAGRSREQFKRHFT